MSSSSAASTDLHALQTCGDDVIRTVNLLCSEAPRHDACGELGHELHELSLSTGTMDRQMFHFVCDVLLDGTAIDPRRATDSSLRNALGLATRTPYVKRTSLLRGGVASFYFLTSLVLREARVAIRRASKIDTGNYMGRRMLSGSAVAFALLQAGKRLLRYGRLPRALPTLYSAVYAGLLSWFAITYYQMRRPLNKLKQCNKRLLHMLRMWSILQSVVAQASLRRAVSYVELDSIGRSQSSGQGSAAHRTGGGGRGIAAKSFLSLVALPNREDKHQRHDRSTYRGLLSFAPPPVSGAFWYDDGGLVSQYGIKHGLNVLYACCRFALGVTGLKWYYPLGYGLQLMALPYYACQPRLAASRAHSFIVDANAQMIQAAWSPMMNKVAVPIALALHAKWRLPVCDYVQLGESGPGAYIFCATSLTQLGPHPKVLFYFFGGGFIGNLFSGDISFITSWAQAFPDVIIVCPQYDIAPEPYPVALNQCVAAYMAVMKHGILGCMPSSCVISGQSAGGMLAASLCVRLAQKGGRGGGALRSGQVKRSTKATAGGGNTSSKADSGSSHRSKYHHHHHTGFRDEVKALVMWYPTLNASLAPSPSRVLFVNDVLLPHGLTSAAVDSYVPENKDANDPCCSPVFASDETLARFPQTYIIAAGLDPLLDDSVDFHTRLCRNRSPAKLKIWRGLTHGFMNMDAVNAEAAEAQASTVEMLREALYE